MPEPQDRTEVPKDLSKLEADLDQSERKLLALVGTEKPERGAADVDAAEKPERGAAEVDEAQKPGASAGAGSARPSTAPVPKAAEGPDCETACKAFGSMLRSRDRICELTAEDDEHCVSATTRVDGARERVRQAGCSCG